MINSFLWLTGLESELNGCLIYVFASPFLSNERMNVCQSKEKPEANLPALLLNVKRRLSRPLRGKRPAYGRY
jgi:hypothetical protein